MSAILHIWSDNGTKGLQAVGANVCRVYTHTHTHTHGKAGRGKGGEIQICIRGNAISTISESMSTKMRRTERFDGKSKKIA